MQSMTIPQDVLQGVILESILDGMFAYPVRLRPLPVTREWKPNPRNSKRPEYTAI